VVLCLERVFVSWLLARDRHGEHSGLRGLGRRSVTPYVHREESCIAQAWACQGVPESVDSFVCLAIYSSKP
jgi:hypothetical protein